MRMPPITEDFLLWIVLPALVSLAVVVLGLRVRARPARTSLVILGLVGLVLSALWFLLVLRIEYVEHQNMGAGGNASSAAPHTTV
jgi:hypothetical protein